MYHKDPAEQVQIDFSRCESNVAFLRKYLSIFLLILGNFDGVIATLNADEPQTPGQSQSSQSEDQSLKRISNGQISVGIKPESGGAIAWVAAEPGGKNLVNSHDRGRLIQQSYYGKDDGSLWNKQPWRWNPVQGGDWRGSSAKVIELSIKESSAYVKTLPKHWASGEDLRTTNMQQWIELDGPVAHVKYRFEQRSGEDHPAVHQELPAVFVQAELRNLVVYDGQSPWTDGPVTRSVPGWPNEHKKMTERWAAYVDGEDKGIGVYVPVALELTCYRFGSSEKAPGACSYFAPIRTFAITRDFDWQYDVFITVGTLDEIRSRFGQLHAKHKDQEILP